jgi:DNA-binding NarL/FixJ family response regulator
VAICATALEEYRMLVPVLVVGGAHHLLSGLIASALAPWYSVAHHAGTLDEMESMLGAPEPPRLVVVSLRSRTDPWLAALLRWLVAFPLVPFLAVVEGEDTEMLHSARGAGLAGVLCLYCSATELRLAIEEILSGGRYISSVRPPGGTHDLVIRASDLTDCELAVAKHLVEGHHQKHIATLVGRCPKEIEYLVKGIRRHLPVQRGQRVRWRCVAIV